MAFKKIIIITVIFLVSFVVFWYLSQPKEIQSVIIGEKTLSVEVMRTNFELKRGLSGHLPLTKEEGMLFIFEKEDFYGIWMKDMLFPIDVLWIDSGLRVIHMEKNILPETYPKVFYPKTKNLYVLEVSTGQIDALNIEIGAVVKFIRK